MNNPNYKRKGDDDDLTRGRLGRYTTTDSFRMDGDTFGEKWADEEENLDNAAALNASVTHLEKHWDPNYVNNSKR